MSKMELQLDRRWLTPQATTGELQIDGVFACFTLENPLGQATVPAGRYEVVVTYSPRFLAMLPLLLNVPGRTGIRIHAGNTAADTEGCILVGQTRAADRIGQSRKALDRLLSRLAHRSSIWLTITNPKENDHADSPAPPAGPVDGADS